MWGWNNQENKGPVTRYITVEPDFTIAPDWYIDSKTTRAHLKCHEMSKVQTRTPLLARALRVALDHIQSSCEYPCHPVRPCNIRWHNRTFHREKYGKWAHWFNLTGRNQTTKRFLSCNWAAALSACNALMVLCTEAATFLPRVVFNGPPWISCLQQDVYFLDLAGAQ